MNVNSAEPARRLARLVPMPFAIFDSDTKLSKAYPTEAEVWTHARETGLVIDRFLGDDAVQHILDNNYEIRECQPDPGESPRANEREAEQAAKDYPFLKSA